MKVMAITTEAETMEGLEIRTPKPHKITARQIDEISNTNKIATMRRRRLNYLKMGLPSKHIPDFHKNVDISNSTESENISNAAGTRQQARNILKEFEASEC